MSTDRETTRIVRSWLEEGATALPDRVLDAVLDQVPATPQRRSPWPTRRLSDMNHALRLGIAAAAVVTVAFVGLALLPGWVASDPASGSSSPSARPTTTVNPAISPTPAASLPTAPSPSQVGAPLPGLAEGSVIPGTYQNGASGVPISLVVPDGWAAGAGNQGGIYYLETRSVQANGLPTGDVFVSFWHVTNVMADGCSGRLHEPEIGPGVDDLVAAIAAIPGVTTTTPVPVNLDGYEGVEFELEIGVDLGCGADTFELWVAGSNRRPAIALGAVDHIRIFDVNGTRALVAGTYMPSTIEGDIAEMESILDSIHFLEPATPAPSTAP